MLISVFCTGEKNIKKSNVILQRGNMGDKKLATCFDSLNPVIEPRRSETFWHSRQGTCLQDHCNGTHDRALRHALSKGSASFLPFDVMSTPREACYPSGLQYESMNTRREYKSAVIPFFLSKGRNAASIHLETFSLLQTERHIYPSRASQRKLEKEPFSKHGAFFRSSPLLLSWCYRWGVTEYLQC